MIKRTVEVSTPSYLHVERGQMAIERDGQRVGQVPIEDLGILILNHSGAVVTQGLLDACSENNAVVVCCDGKRLPSSILLPLSGHSVHAETLRAQVAMTLPRRKRLWQQIVRSKIAAQARLLGQPGKRIADLAPLVRSGDPDNIEARAARAYWPLLFGPSFRRNRTGAGVNSLLNYGYAVLRAVVARAICAAGLHPSVELHHHNRYDSLCLASDLMEPLRPAGRPQGIAPTGPCQ